MLDYFVKMSTCSKSAKAIHDLIKKSFLLSLNNKVNKATHDEHHPKVVEYVVFTDSHFSIISKSSSLKVLDK